MSTESINAVKSRIKNIREWVTPARTTSAFLTKGVLTPEEFVKAGDELVFKCPTWSWGEVSDGDPSKIRSILPRDKQFLITRNVPCAERVQQMETTAAAYLFTEVEEQQQQKDDAEGWLISHVMTKKIRSNNDTIMQEEDEEEFDFVTTNNDGENEIITSTQYKSSIKSSINSNNDELFTTNHNNEDDDEYGDMSAFEDETMTQDDATAAATTTTDNNNNNNNDNIKRVRTYDISITYDKYYQTPKVWIFGYSENNTPLTTKEMFQDIMTDYVQRTVTIENHPHVVGPHLSIHACQHAAVMKNIVRNLSSSASLASSSSNTNNSRSSFATTPTVEIYLFIFLKFVSSIIPTINYDFTFEVTASTRKE